jgi:hypothetical protein
MAWVGPHQELLEQLVGIIYSLRILPDDPNHAGLGLCLIQRVQALAQGGDDALIPATTGLPVSSLFKQATEL